MPCPRTVHLTLRPLSRIDELLASKGTRFLTGDTMCCFDCELMPKLQHIRVAGHTHCLLSMCRYITAWFSMSASYHPSVPIPHDWCSNAPFVKSDRQAANYFCLHPHKASVQY